MLRWWRTRRAKAGIALALAVLLAGCSSNSSPPPPPAATSFSNVSPSAWSVEFSTDVPQPAAASAGWQIPFPTSPGSLNYVVAPVNLNLVGAAAVTATFKITGSNPAFIFTPEPTNTCGGLANMHLFIQQQGDNLSGAGAYQFYRWWSNPADITLALGSFSLSSPLSSGSWSSVLGAVGDSSAAAQAGFVGAMAKVGNIGMTFGGGCFDGHGVSVTSGSATFNLTGFLAQ
jgi:hypothetical protein